MDGRDEDNKLLTAAESEMSTRGPTSDTEAGDAASGLAVADCARADILVLRYFFSLRFFKSIPGFRGRQTSQRPKRKTQ